jgi:hypothetical protein
MRKILLSIIIVLGFISVRAQEEYIPNLQTETITVFDTIDMDGGRITNVGDGIDSSDVITLRQLMRNTSTLDSSAVIGIVDQYVEDSSIVEMRDTLPITGKIATRWDLQQIEDSLGYFTRKTSGFMGIVEVTSSSISVAYPGYMASNNYILNFSAVYNIIDGTDTIPMINGLTRPIRKDSLGFQCELSVAEGYIQFTTYDTTGVTLTSGGFVEIDPIFSFSLASEITASDTARWATNEGIETDPIYATDSSFIKSGVRDWNSSLAKTIDTSDTTRWAADNTIPYPSAGIPISTGSAWGTSYSTNGSGSSLILSTSPTLITPTLGVATATSVNKVTITQPATSSTITVVNGKTFTSSNTLTLSGTDGSTLNVGTGGILGTAAFTASTSYESFGSIGTHSLLQTGIHGLNITALKTLTVQKSISFNAADDTGVYTLPTGTKTLLAIDGSAANLTDFPALNQNTSGSAGSLKSTTTTGLMTVTGMGTGTTRAKTVRDANDTFLELGGSYTPTGTWNWQTAVVSWPTFNQNTSGSSASCTGNSATATLLQNARTINGVSFDGSANVSVPSNITPGTSGNLMISNGTVWTSSAPPTWNQNTSGVAAKATILETTRAIYGNNFNGSAALTQIIASTYGGTGNGFTKFTGATTSEKTYTLPNSNATLLYSGGALGIPSSGTVTNLTGTASININGTVGSTTPTTGVFTTATVNTSLLPDAIDGAALGTTSAQFSDLFLAEGAVINFDNGDVTITQTGNELAISGAGLKADGYTTLGQTLTFNDTNTTMDWLSGADGVLTITGNITALTLSNVPDGSYGDIFVIQDATGGFGISALAHTGLTVKYIGGNAPTSSYINSVANAHSVISYKRRGSYLYCTYGKY